MDKTPRINNAFNKANARPDYPAGRA